MKAQLTQTGERAVASGLALIRRAIGLSAGVGSPDEGHSEDEEVKER